MDIKFFLCPPINGTFVSPSTMEFKSFDSFVEGKASGSDLDPGSDVDTDGDPDLALLISEP